MRDIDAKRYAGRTLRTFRSIKDHALAPVAYGQALIEFIGVQTARWQSKWHACGSVWQVRTVRGVIVDDQFRRVAWNYPNSIAGGSLVTH